MKILLSIRPHYAYQIFSGSKRFEFRKVLYKNPEVTTVVVYATKPVGKVIGEFTISGVHKESPEELWRRTKMHSGISESFFIAYFEGREVACAIEVESTTLYPEPKELRDVVTNGLAPQSFRYLVGE